MVCGYHIRGNVSIHSVTVSFWCAVSILLACGTAFQQHSVVINFVFLLFLFIYLY